VLSLTWLHCVHTHACMCTRTRVIPKQMALGWERQEPSLQGFVRLLVGLTHPSASSHPGFTVSLSKEKDAA